MKILVTGRNGQVGRELAGSLAGLGELVLADRALMDLSRPESLRAVVRAVAPDLIVNAAAYTAVDQAESDADAAMRVNGEAPGVLAEEAKRLGAAIVHYSTDYVFDGSKEGAWLEDDPPNPLSVYGRSKLAGERAIAASGAEHLILRTSWVYGTHGKNFLLTMLRLAQEKDELSVVSDQFGAPTWSRTIAEATAEVVRRREKLARHGGVYHLCAGGCTSWHGFAQRIFALAPTARKPLLHAITTADYPTPAKRPHNSRLDTGKFQRTFCALPQWDEALAQCLREPPASPAADTLNH